MRRALASAVSTVAILSIGFVTLTAHAAARQVPRVVPCVGRPQVRPIRFVLACADENAYLTSLHWVRWSPSVGIARGIDHENDCTPDCAAGHFHETWADVVFSDPVPTQRFGSLFSVVTVLLSSRLPGVPRSVTSEPLPLSAT
jgi:hypothetical protein